MDNIFEANLLNLANVDSRIDKLGIMTVFCGANKDKIKDSLFDDNIQLFTHLRPFKSYDKILIEYISFFQNYYHNWIVSFEYFCNDLFSEDNLFILCLYILKAIRRKTSLKCFKIASDISSKVNEQISISENDPISENYNNKLERLKTGIGYNILVNYWNQFQDLHHITVNRMDIFRLSELIRSKTDIYFNYKEMIKAMEDSLEPTKTSNEYEMFKKQITFNKPQSLHDYIKNYIELFEADSIKNKNIEYIKRLLNESHILIPDTSDISKIIRDGISQKELSVFEYKISKSPSEHIDLGQIDNMSGLEFEIFVGNLYKNMGFNVEYTAANSDQGADVIVNKFGEKSCIQAKRHNSKISNKAIQEVVAAIKHYNADKGCVITSNYFTASAEELAKSNNITLYDRDDLQELISKFM